MKLRFNEGPSDKLIQENQMSHANTRSSRDTLEIRSEFRKLSTTVFVDNPVSENSISVDETVKNINKAKISIRKVIGSIGIILIVTGCFILGFRPSYEDETFYDESDHKLMQKLKHMEMYDTEYDDFPDDFLRNSCEADEYGIKVQMSGKLYSGTDDQVEICLHGQNGEKTEWFELTNGSKNNKLERLSLDVFCANFKNQPATIGLLENIGIRKFGSDRMMIHYILIQINHSNMLFRQRQVGRWIKTNAEEYIFTRL